MKKRFLFIICVLNIGLMGCTQQNNSKQTGEQNKIEIDTNSKYDSSETTSGSGESSDKNLDSSAEQVCWDGLTEDGIDEEVFLEDLDLEMLQEVAGNLQSAVDEEIQDEKDNPEILLTEGWIRI